MRTKDIDSLLWRGYGVPENTKAEINRLFSMTVNELRAKFRETVGYDTQSRNKDFLLRKIAWKLQSKVFGDIPDEARRRAMEIADFSRLRIRDTIMPKFNPVIMDERRLKLGNVRDPRLPMAGGLLCKTHNGAKVMVKVLENGFEYDGVEYSSLSAIARKITGTNWNGFKFFGL